MNLKKVILPSLAFFLFFAAKEIVVTDYLNLPAIPYEYNVTLPAYFTNSAAGDDNTPATNPTTNNGATLGRVLFYDKNLSLNRTVSCASCHKATEGFSDSRVLGIGFEGGTTGRHGMTLINARYYQNGHFFWDERAATLETQVLLPLQDATEMGLTAAQISERVAAQPYYNQLFINAFGDNAVTNDRVSKVLAQFVRSIVSYQSKYDIGRALVNNRNANFPNFTAQENQGKQLFLAPIPNGGGGCAGCHNSEAFISLRPENNGLDLVTTDSGVGGVAPIRQNLIGTFKNSSIRNIELTAPYMHDGRFATLEQVVEHYNSGIQAHPTLSNPLKNPNGTPVRLNFDATQKIALVAFMKTLTDNSLATEVRWSNPFCSTNLSFSGTVTSGTFQSSNEISVQNGSITQIQSGNEVNFFSGKSIILNPTFEAKAGSVFKAQITGCN